MSLSVQITLATVQSWHERIVKLAERIAVQREQARASGTNEGNRAETEEGSGSE